MLADEWPINHSFSSLQVLEGIPGESCVVPDGWESIQMDDALSIIKAAELNGQTKGPFIFPAESFIFTNGATRLGGEELKVLTVLEVS